MQNLHNQQENDSLSVPGSTHSTCERIVSHSPYKKTCVCLTVSFRDLNSRCKSLLVIVTTYLDNNQSRLVLSRGLQFLCLFHASSAKLVRTNNSIKLLYSICISWQKIHYIKALKKYKTLRNFFLEIVKKFVTQSFTFVFCIYIMNLLPDMKYWFDPCMPVDLPAPNIPPRLSVRRRPGRNPPPH